MKLACWVIKQAAYSRIYTLSSLQTSWLDQDRISQQNDGGIRSKSHGSLRLRSKVDVFMCSLPAISYKILIVGSQASNRGEKATDLELGACLKAAIEQW